MELKRNYAPKPHRLHQIGTGYSRLASLYKIRTP